MFFERDDWRLGPQVKRKAEKLERVQWWATQDDYGPEVHFLKKPGSFCCAVMRLQETTTRKVVIDSVLQDDTTGSSQKLILRHSSCTSGKTCSTGTGYPEREKDGLGGFQDTNEQTHC